MKKKNRVLACLLLAIGFALIFANSCKKDDENENNNNPILPANTVTDIDGNVYHTVTIGTQMWMVENLKTTKYRNGDPIPNITNDVAWDTITIGVYCNYNNDTINSTTYGRLYNWYAVNDSRYIAPAGWHVPTDTEWSILTTYLGGESIAGGKLKEAGTTHWQSPNTGATNEVGFNALPGGLRNLSMFEAIGNIGTWWSSTEGSSNYAWSRYMYDFYSKVARGTNGSYKQLGHSVRCIKD